MWEVIQGIFFLALFLVIVTLLYYAIYAVGVTILFAFSTVIVIGLDILLYPVLFFLWKKENFPLSRYYGELWGNVGDSEILANRREKKREKRAKKVKRQIQKDVSKRIYCDICGEAYMTLSGLETHKLIKHDTRIANLEN